MQLVAEQDVNLKGWFAMDFSYGEWALLGAVVFVALLVAIWWFSERSATKALRRKDLARWRARLETWLAEVEATDSDEQLVELGRKHHQSPPEDLKLRLMSARSKCDKARRATNWRALLATYSNEDTLFLSQVIAGLELLGVTKPLAGQIDDPYNEVDDPSESLVDIREWKRVTGYTPELLAAEIRAYIEAQLLAAVNDGIASSLMQYHQVCVGWESLSWDSDSSDVDEGRLLLEHLEQWRPELPADWNDLVARVIEIPSIELFAVTPDPEPGRVRFLAAQALAERSLTLGKIVLAYCSVSRDVEGHSSGYGGGHSLQVVWPYQLELDGLSGEVTKMVYALHRELALSGA